MIMIERPEERGGDVGEVAGDEAPHTPVPLHRLSVAADDAGPATVSLQ